MILSLLDGLSHRQYHTARRRGPFTGPYGSFYLRPTIRPILMLAGGTGLAPFLSMLLWIKENPTDQPILLAYGVNTNDDLVELETLNELKSAMPNFSGAAASSTSRS